MLSKATSLLDALLPTGHCLGNEDPVEEGVWLVNQSHRDVMRRSRAQIAQNLAILFLFQSSGNTSQ